MVIVVEKGVRVVSSFEVVFIFSLFFVLASSSSWGDVFRDF